MEIIRTAVGSIRDGIHGIDMQLQQISGVLAKEEVLGMHKKLKEMRQKAQKAEDAFGEWAVALARGPTTAEQQAHDELRHEFEDAVASIQALMTRVASEVKRRKAEAKKSQTAKKKLESSINRPDARPIDTENLGVSGGNWGPGHSGARTSFASSSKGYHKQSPSDPSDAQSSEPAEKSRKIRKGRFTGLNPWIKYFLGLCLFMLGYLVWTHTRYLVLATSALPAMEHRKLDAVKTKAKQIRKELRGGPEPEGVAAVVSEAAASIEGAASKVHDP